MLGPGSGGCPRTRGQKEPVRARVSLEERCPVSRRSRSSGFDAGREADEAFGGGLARPAGSALPGRLDAAEARARPDDPRSSDDRIGRTLRPRRARRRGAARNRPASGEPQPRAPAPRAQGSGRRAPLVLGEMPRQDERVLRLALDPERQRPEPAVREPRTARDAAPAPRHARSRPPSSLVTRRHEPSRRSELPDAIFVSDVSVAVAPWSSGRWSTAVATVLSTTSGAPASAAARPSASRSMTRRSGFVGVSRP